MSTLVHPCVVSRTRQGNRHKHQGCLLRIPGQLPRQQGGTILEC
ncbi:unnamed protein product [Linum tenue]|uniref:Uncharacterized protein n=1 Tax=Linum tenue TaxID=586396 RepID=A0AAV0L557_9ROSI|nr:unnamed protein product [Linum tenue]